MNRPNQREQYLDKRKTGQNWYDEEGGFDNNEISLYPLRYITATLRPLSWSVVKNIYTEPKSAVIP